MTEEKLSSFLKTGMDGSRLKTNVRRVLVLKLPAYQSSPTRLSIELNLVDEEDKPKKRRGLILRSSSGLEDFREIFQDNKLSKLLSAIDMVNPGTKAVKRRDGEDVLEL